jgi:hypothetical protein
MLKHLGFFNDINLLTCFGKFKKSIIKVKKSTIKVKQQWIKRLYKQAMVSVILVFFLMTGNVPYRSVI